jgi:hypothetical protein
MKALLALSFIVVLASVAFVSPPAPAQESCLQRCIFAKTSKKGSCTGFCHISCEKNCASGGKDGKGKKGKGKKSKKKSKKKK